MNLKPPTVLLQTKIHGIEVSTIRIHTDNEGGGYFETMLFLNGQEVNGLTDYETYSLFEAWRENHEALESKIRSVLAYGPVRGARNDA